MKINENPFPAVPSGEKKAKGCKAGIGAGRLHGNSDGVSISSRKRIAQLMKKIDESRIDSERDLSEIAVAIRDGRYLPSADDVADAILDEMDMLGELLQWSDLSES